MNYDRLSARAKLLIRNEKHRHQAEKCESVDMVKAARKAWRLLHSLRGIDHTNNQTPLRKGDGYLANAVAKKADHINRHFAQVNQAGPLIN